MTRQLSLTRRDPFTWGAMWTLIVGVGAVALIELRGGA